MCVLLFLLVIVGRPDEKRTQNENRNVHWKIKLGRGYKMINAFWLMLRYVSQNRNNRNAKDALGKPVVLFV